MKSIKNTKVTMTPYARVEKLEEGLKQFLVKEKLSESKIKIKNILRESSESQSKGEQIIAYFKDGKFEDGNVNLEDYDIFINNYGIAEGILPDSFIEKYGSIKSALAKAIVMCTFAAGALTSCTKEPTFVYEYSYRTEGSIASDLKRAPDGSYVSKGKWFLKTSELLSADDLAAKEKECYYKTTTPDNPVVSDTIVLINDKAWK